MTRRALCRMACSMIVAGVDAWNLTGDRRGIGRYVRALLREWERSFADRISVTLVVPEWYTWMAAHRYRAAAGNPAHRVVSRAGYKRCGLNVMWFPFNGPSWDGFAVPSVATLHDAAPFVLPEYSKDARDSFCLAAERCDRIVTDSEFSRNELLRELPIDPARIAAIPLGVADPLPPSGVQIDIAEPFVLFTGETSPRKGLDTLVQAIEQLQARGLDLLLAVAGTPTPFSRSVLEQARCRVRELGHVDDRMLAALYRSCAAFVYPSQYEGFGLPVLEAMSYGAPVVASSAAGIPEAGGDAPLYFTGGEAAELAAALLRIVREPELGQSLRERGYERAAAMPWRRTAEATLAVLEQTAR